MAWESLIPVVGGLAASLFGGNKQAKAAKAQADAQVQAGRESRDFDQGQALDVMVRQMKAMYGKGSKARAKLEGYLPREQLAMIFGGQTQDLAPKQKLLESLEAQLAATKTKNVGSGVYGGSTERQKLVKQIADLRSEIDASTISGRWQDSQFEGDEPGFLDQMQGLIDQYGQESQGLLNSYDADTGRISDMGQESLDSLYGFGDSRKAAIDRDATRASRQNNAAINAQMARSGLSGSSLAAQALTGSNRSIMESASDRKGTIEDQIMALMNSTRGDNINRFSNRASGRTSLAAGVMDQNQALRQQPLQAEMSMLMGDSFAPFANRSSTSYFPGVTGKGLQGAAMGATIGQVGAQGFGFGSDILGEELKKLWGQRKDADT